MDEEDLLEAVAGDLVQYVMGGDFPKDDIAELFKPPELPPEYDDFDTLADLHFVLNPRVRKFADDLQDMLRHIQTETRAKTTVQRGGLDGHIDWGTTYQYRSTSSPGDRNLYAVKTREEEYEIPENITLKSTVGTIATALENVDRLLDPSMTWAEESWIGEQDLRREFLTLAQRNHHLQQIPDPPKDGPSARVVERTAASRQRLYRRAADLWKTRQEYEQGPTEEFFSLLTDTIITPERREDLFELYVLFRVLEALSEKSHPRIGQPTYNTIDKKRESVASFDGTAKLRVYYDQTPNDPDISFLALGEHESATTRHEFIHERSLEYTSLFFKDTDKREHTKRPDVLVVAENETEPTKDYLAVEVKDSTRDKTIRQGITELLEYLSFLRRNKETRFQPGDFGSGMNGLLVVQDIEETNVRSVNEQAAEGMDIRIVQASELNDVLDDACSRVFIDNSNIS